MNRPVETDLTADCKASLSCYEKFVKAIAQTNIGLVLLMPFTTAK